MAGVSAAYLAGDGFTGAPAIIMEDDALAHVWSDMGSNWHITQQYIKLYPVCRWAQPAVEAMLALVKAHGFGALDVVAITIDSFHEAKQLAVIPDNTEQAQYSLPFPAAAALVRGTLGVDEVAGSGLEDPDIRRIAQMITITERDEFNAAFPARRFASAAVRLKDGMVFESGPTEARGDPENKLPDEVIWHKFSTLTHPVLGRARAESLQSLVTGLAHAQSTVSLFDLLGADAAVLENA